MKLKTILFALTLVSTFTQAEELTSIQFNEQYQIYKLKLEQDQARETKLRDEESGASLLITCDIWDSKIKMYNLASDNTHLANVGTLAKNLGNEIMLYELTLKSSSGNTHKENCDLIRSFY